MSDEILAGTGFGTFEKQDAVLVGLSGGVDSSVCIRILQQQGFSVTALVIDFSPAHHKAVEAAKAVAGQLHVPLVVRECHDLFHQEVITPFCESYCKGETPNPCIFCNPAVKFRILCEEADKRGISYIATGHYARVEACADGIFRLAIAESAARDQSYMLYRLGQEVLSRLCLPLGEFEKDDIREMARELGLASADAPDSQEICFIPDGNHAAYIESHGFCGKAGRFISPDGTDLGPHKGVSHYTVGQRKGLGLALGRPVFVREITDSGNIHLAFSGGEYAKGFSLRHIVTANAKPLHGAYEVKIRSMAKAVACKVENGRAVFIQPARAPAPGQSAVFYRKGFVEGGGYISQVDFLT